MQKEKVKLLVQKTNVLLSTEDRELSSDATIELADDLLKSLCIHAKKNPFFAVAIYNHTIEAGFVLNKAQAFEQFMVDFGKALESVDARQLTTIRAISGNLFSENRV